MSYVSEVLADSPAVYLRCQEASGLLQDSSGNARHATGSGGVLTYQQPSPLVSDPSDKSVFLNLGWFSVPDSAGLDLGDVFTLECWVKRTTTGIIESLIIKGTAAYELSIEASNKVVLNKFGSGVLRRSSTTITDTDWHHLFATKNGTAAFIYIDNVDVSTFVVDGTCLDSTVALFIGQDSFGGGLANSRVDEIAVYPTVLSSARRLAHYEAGIAPLSRYNYSKFPKSMMRSR